MTSEELVNELYLQLCDAQLIQYDDMEPWKYDNLQGFCSKSWKQFGTATIEQRHIEGIILPTEKSKAKLFIRDLILTLKTNFKQDNIFQRYDLAFRILAPFVENEGKPIWIGLPQNHYRPRIDVLLKPKLVE